MRLAFALMAAWSASAAAVEPAPDFIAGDWCAVNGESRFEERWTAAADGRMHALARSFKGARLTGFEFLRIEPVDGAYAYIAQPGGNPPTVFGASERGDQRIVFTNPQHDYPQRIEYWRDGSGLHAKVSGAPTPGEAPQQFDFRPGACESLAPPAAPAAARTMAEVLAASSPGDWRQPDPARTLYLELASGRVIIELAPDFAPQHVANILKLARGGYYDGLAILRVQDNFVVQWGDPDAEDEAKRKPLPEGAVRTLTAEFTRPDSRDLPFLRLPDADG